MARNYFDFSLFDEIGDAMDLFANTIRNAFEFDALEGIDTFNAIVLTQPVPMDPRQIQSFVETETPKLEDGFVFGPDAEEVTNYVQELIDADTIPKFIFKARIIGPLSPHLFLPNPCDIKTANEIKKQQNIQEIIDMHTTVIANDSTVMPRIGSIVKIRVPLGQMTINPQVADFVGVITDVPSAVTNLLKSQQSQKECGAMLREAFANGNYNGASVGSIQVRRTFAIYNGRTRDGRSKVEVENGRLREAGVPLRAAKEGLYSGNKPLFVSRATDQFEKLAQQYKDEHGGKVLKINSSYRSFQEQIDMKVSKTSKGKPGEAATPGRSNHGWGVAFDVGGTGDDGPNRFKSKIYLWLDANAPKYGFVNPSNLREGSSNPEAWHWENVEIRDELFKTERIEPGWVSPDGAEIPPEEREQS